ncbi:hypothetical protein ACIO3S_24580 [Nocardioides sp. NPDC087217]|uniref:hypothetical protein n=1 Tax=Nocardioides sp. NPDC087217 TaxID=3364335 RepID=UPI00380700DE
MNAPNPDIHEVVLDAIQAQINTLQSGALTSAPGGGARTEKDLAAELTQLETDRTLLRAHWAHLPRPIPATEPPRSNACGETQPCTHVRALKQKYCS